MTPAPFLCGSITVWLSCHGDPSVMGVHREFGNVL
jgi:hypothetical protein